MSFKNLLYEVKDKAAVITVNRPEKLNALNTETIRELGSAVKQAEADADVVAVIITGAGEKSFVAGADISEFNDLDEQGGIDLARAGHEVFNSIEALSKPVIAAVNGFALGGGCELAMACHLRVATDNSMFGQPEVKLGLIPGYGGTQRLPRLIGRTKAMELLMTTDMINGDEALRLGLVNYVTTGPELLDKCFEVVKKISKQGPLAIKGIIASVNAYYKDGADGFEAEITEFGKCFLTDDFKEGSSAFMEKRKPEFKGK
jgi:enoyl-CoA hydratase